MFYKVVWQHMQGMVALLITTHTHTHQFNCAFPGLPGWVCTRKAKPIWILLKQETLSGSGISWAICKSATRSRQTTTPTPTTQFFKAGCPSCRQRQSTERTYKQFTANLPENLPVKWFCKLLRFDGIMVISLCPHFSVPPCTFLLYLLQKNTSCLKSTFVDWTKHQNCQRKRHS